MNFKFTHHDLAGSKKYTLSKNLNNSAKVHLLLKDDANSFLSATQRTDLMAAVGEQYEATKTKKTRAAKKEALAKLPKIHISQVPAGTPAEVIMQGLKDGTIVVG